jgi:multicomponent K+:H+ antiporter subunit A
MAAGIVDHECGTRDMRRLGGLWLHADTATLAIIGAGAMAGVPLLNGFLSKEMFFAETVALRRRPIRPLDRCRCVATVAGMLAVAYSARFVHDVFFNGPPRRRATAQPHEPPRWMRAPIELLVLLCLLVGVLPAWTVAPLLDAAAGATLQGPLPDFHLALWHGFNQPLLMSLLALAGGVLIYALRQPLFAWHEQLPRMHARTAFERFYRFTQSRCPARRRPARQRLAAALRGAALRLRRPARNLGICLRAGRRRHPRAGAGRRRSRGRRRSASCCSVPSARRHSTASGCWR